ncbi:multidrug resistance-associated protein 5 [Tanacetum coccineum]|uniref:Multidrug resistance-associated protein 5 n=1 Tax=Tanacetum coccineum TaxID=301880 RepID=A0ABQ5FF10_9ASTR
MLRRKVGEALRRKGCDDSFIRWSMLRRNPSGVSQFKEYLTYYALENGFSLWYERSEEVRVVAKCGQRPPRLSDPEKGKQRKQTKYHSWIAKIFGDKIKANPDIRLCDIADLVMKKYKFKVSPTQCTNAKKYALTEYEKIIGEHYSMLRSYGKAILDSNLGSTVKLGVTVNPDGKTYFDRFYVCFVGLTDGWKAWCRKIIALDGCLLKSPNQGEILTTIGRDGNNHIYPVAWAVVNVENKDNWTWFLELLEQDLGSSRGNGLTLMSDQHKGLIEAVKDVMPNAEHRQCARHIYENFRKQYPGLEFRQLLWEASKASYPQLFNKIIDKIKSANPNAHKYLMDKNPKIWSRAFFELLLTMLEAIRVIVLERMNKMRENSRKWNPEVCPNIKKILEWLKEQQSMYSTVLPPKPRKLPGRPRKKRIRSMGEGGSSTRVSKVGRPRNKQSVNDLEDVDVVHRGPMRDEGAGGSRGCARGSRARGGVSRSRGGTSRSRGGASVMRFLALGWHLEEIHVTWAHLEKKRTKLRLYTKNHEELCIQSVETASPL